MREKGIYVDKMYFSGFWSQGDGASFEGHISDFETFWNAHKIQVPTVADFLSRGLTSQVSLHCSVRGRYVHERSMRFDDVFEIEGQRFSSSLQEAAWQVKTQAAATEWSSFVERAEEIFRDHARDLYRQLEEEYNYLTSDEQVLESLLANGLLEEELERYESDRDEEGDEGTDPDALQELLLRPAVAVSQTG